MFKQMQQIREEDERHANELSRKHVDYASTIDLQARKIRELTAENARLNAELEALRAAANPAIPSETTPAKP